MPLSVLTEKDMKLLLLMTLVFGFNAFAKDVKEVKSDPTPSSEEILPDTVDISNEIVEINQNYIRDIASGVEKEEKVDTESVPFWSFEN